MRRDPGHVREPDRMAADEYQRLAGPRARPHRQLIADALDPDEDDMAAKIDQLPSSRDDTTVRMDTERLDDRS
jgi:hypothetical protein